MSYYSAKELGYNPLGLWRFGEAVGATTATDASGHGNTGTISGGVTLAVPGLITGDRDTAYLFDGVTGVVTLPLITTKTASILLAAWVTLPTSGGHGAIIKIGDSTSGYGLGIGATTLDSAGTNIVANLHGVANLPTGVSLSVGIQHHVAMVIVGSIWYFFLDGDLCSNLTLSIASAITPATSCYVGNDPTTGTRHLNAVIDEPFIADVSHLNLTQIAAMVADLYLQVPLELPPAPIGSPSGYLVVIGNKDRSPDTNISYTAITTGLNDRMPQVQLSIDDSLCLNPINILDEVVIIDQHTVKPTHNYVVAPNITGPQIGVYSGVDGVGVGAATVTIIPGAIHCVANGSTIAGDASLEIQNIPQTAGIPGPLSTLVRPVVGQAYCLSSQMTVLSTLVHCAGVIRFICQDGGFTTLATFTSTLQTATGMMSVQGIIPVGTFVILCEWGLEATGGGACSGTLEHATLQFEPVWFPYLQSYPTPFCATGQAGCYVMPNNTTVRQNRIFAGIVADANPGNSSGDSEQSGYNGVSRTWDVACKGPNWLLDSIRVNAVYTAQQDYQIITSIASNQLPNAITTNNTQVGVVIDQRAYDFNTFTDVLADMCNTSGFVTYLDFYYDLHYIDVGSEQALAALSDNPDTVTSFAYSYWDCPRDGNNIQNAVIVKGGQFTGTYTDSYIASGSQKQFTLTQLAPTAIDSIVINGVTQTVGIDGVSTYSFSNSQVLANFPGHFFRLNANVPAGQLVVCTYKYSAQLRVLITDLGSVARYNGVTITGTIEDTSITTSTAGIQRGIAFLNEFSTELISPHFRTFLPLNVGQVVLITNALETVQGVPFSSKPFLVQSVTIHLLGNGTIEYEATCGSDIPTFTRMQHRVHKTIQRSKQLPANVYSNTGFAVSDAFTMGSDSISIAALPNTKLYNRSALYGTAAYS